MTLEIIYYIALAALTVTIVGLFWELIEAVRNREVWKFMLLLSFIDAVFGPSLAIAPRCSVCGRITADLERCRQKHTMPEDDIRGCGMMLCPRCQPRGK
jgi:hypothetical protein